MTVESEQHSESDSEYETGSDSHEEEDSPTKPATTTGRPPTYSGPPPPKPKSSLATMNQMAPGSTGARRCASGNRTHRT
jgi:hypothetical protein